MNLPTPTPIPFPHATSDRWGGRKTAPQQLS